jgi:hypothetical protein
MAMAIQPIIEPPSRANTAVHQGIMIYHLPCRNTWQLIYFSHLKISKIEYTTSRGVPP